MMQTLGVLRADCEKIIVKDLVPELYLRANSSEEEFDSFFGDEDDEYGDSGDDNRVVFANQVGEVPLDWALGAFIMQKTAEAAIHPDWNAIIIHAILSRLRSIFRIRLNFYVSEMMSLHQC
ncbi:putative apyrase 6 [Platanthera guangdongensis]|uniref:Apyrase 6 n=1 Tax=Platanthera guangdongensis TaxID=2320717 RepID=A0ABR2LP43_9ASPA